MNGCMKKCLRLLHPMSEINCHGEITYHNGIIEPGSLRLQIRCSPDCALLNIYFKRDTSLAL